MLNKLIAVAAAALLVSVGAVQSAGASTTINFDSHTTFWPLANDFTDDGAADGLTFHGFESYYVPPHDPVLTNWPVEAGSTILATAPDYSSATPENLRITYTVGGVDEAFNLGSVWLGLGWYNPVNMVSDMVTITGHKANCTLDCTVTQVAPVGYHFAPVRLVGFDNVDSVSFGPLSTEAFLGFDNIRYGLGRDLAVPEPATWGLMLMGFGGLGAILRHKRRRALALAA